MAQPDGFSPQFPGPVTAQAFVTTLTGNPVKIPQTIKVATNGTTAVDVFGTTNPVAGTFLGAKTVSVDDVQGNVSLKHTVAGTTLFTIAKGSKGAVVGSYLPVGVAFAAGATAQVVSSTAGNAVIEIDFIVSNPQLPGSQ